MDPRLVFTAGAPCAHSISLILHLYLCFPWIAPTPDGPRHLFPLKKKELHYTTSQIGTRLQERG